MVKESIALNIRTKIVEINDYVKMIEDMALEINVEISKKKDGTFLVSITEEV